MRELISIAGILWLLSGTVYAAEVQCLNSWTDRWLFWKVPSENILDIMSENIIDIIKIHPVDAKKTCSEIIIKGEFLEGDSQKLLDTLQNNRPHVSAVYLHSPGGSLEEGVAIGRIIKEHMLDTIAPWQLGEGEGVLYNLLGLRNANTQELCRGTDCICASSCFLAWAGGISREGSALGLHRPTIKSTQYVNMSPDQASILYKDLLKEVRGFMIEMEIHDTFIERMLSIHSNEIYWLTEAEARQLSSPPSMAEWLQATCGRYTQKDNDMFHGLGHKITNKTITKAEWGVLDALLQKNEEIDTCRIIKMYKHRSAVLQKAQSDDATEKHDSHYQVNNEISDQNIPAVEAEGFSLSPAAKEILSYTLIWTVLCLIPPTFIRYFVWCNPLQKWPAIGISFVLWFGNFMLLYGSHSNQNRTNVILTALAYVSYLILRASERNNAEEQKG